MGKGSYTSAEISPPELSGGVTEEAETGIRLLSRYFDRFNIVTKPNRMDSIDFFRDHVRKFGPATVHYATADRDREQVRDDLQRAQESGVETLLILGGDWPADPGERKLYAADAIEMAKSNGHNFGVGAALNIHAKNPDDPVSGELKRLERKIKAGTDYIFLQPTVDPEGTRGFLAGAERYLYENGIDGDDIPPVIEGVMFFDTVSGIYRARNMFHIPVSEETYVEVAKSRYNIGSGSELYRKIRGNGVLGVYVTAFSKNELGLLGEIKKSLFDRG